jgi:hypothetical protein
MGQVQRQIFNLTVTVDISLHALPIVKCGLYEFRYGHDNNDDDGCSGNISSEIRCIY